MIEFGFRREKLQKGVRLEILSMALPVFARPAARKLQLASSEARL